MSANYLEPFAKIQDDTELTFGDVDARICKKYKKIKT
jgi:hypothetical protein